MSLEVTPDQVEDLLHRCAGVTASFIKELLRRASLIAAEREDMASLGLRAADVEPRATEHIPEMIAIIEKLIAKGHAYVTDGSVFFKIASDPKYGALSGFDLDQARQGERVASAVRKARSSSIGTCCAEVAMFENWAATSANTVCRSTSCM